MKASKTSILLFSALIVLFPIACEQSETEQSTEFGTNPTTLPKDQMMDIELGRLLFYDNALSVNNTVSCGSCHKQTLAFADDAALSIGFDSRLTNRNSMPIQNLGSMGRFSFPTPIEGNALFWDGRETNLEEMVLRPIASHIEMGIPDMQYLVDKLSATPHYPELFQDHFHEEGITARKIGLALAEFLTRFESFRSKFDGVGGAFTAQEQFGAQLFIDKYGCDSCHKVTTPGYGSRPDPTLVKFSNIGLDVNSPDPGVGGITKNAEDYGKFKVPSLRNVALTAPYMHDGRFETLEEVLNHYSGGVKSHPNLDDQLKNQFGQPIQLNISETEKQAMIAFLNTFTDFEFIGDPALSDPFK